MKNKKNIYILLPVVIVLWGLVIYRFFSYATPGANENTQAVSFSVKPVTVQQRDTIVLDVNYRDPFLGKMYSREMPKKASGNRKITVKEPIQWPQVIYKGIVSDTKNNKKVFMLIVNGQTHLIKEKETVEGISLKSGNRHSITIKYRGDITEIMIQQ